MRFRISTCNFKVSYLPMRFFSVFFFLLRYIFHKNNLKIKLYDIFSVFLFNTDFPMKACFSTDIELEDRVFATTGNRLSIRFYRNRGFSMAAGFRLVFTTFREGNRFWWFSFLLPFIFNSDI